MRAKNALRLAVAGGVALGLGLVVGCEEDGGGPAPGRDTSGGMVPNAVPQVSSTGPKALTRADADRVKAGQSAAEVKTMLGEHLPGPSETNTSTGYRKETWIYPAGDDAIFVVVENGVVIDVSTERVTMKDAAAKIRVGLTEAEVVAALGPPSGGGISPDSGNGAVTYLNDKAALDSLEIAYQGGAVQRFDVVPNSAIAAYYQNRR